MLSALDALRRRPGRSLLTALGVGLASGLVVLLLALSAGVQSSATTLAYASGVDLLATSSAGGNGTLLSGAPPPISHAHELATAIPRADPNAVVASPWLLGDLVFANASLWRAANATDVPAGWTYTGSGTVGWIPDDLGGIETPTLYNGTGFTHPGDPLYDNGSYAGPATHQIELDQALAGVLHLRTGATVWASPVAPPSTAALPGWYANATAFTVVGISSAFWLVPSAELAFLYLSELQELIGGASASTDYATLILVHLANPTDPSGDQAKIALAFRNLSVYTLSDILGEIQHVVSVYRTFGELIGAVGLVVATLFTTTVLQMSVDDRSREFALLRAVGHRRADIGLAVVEEGLLLSGLGLAIGLPLAYLGSIALDRLLLRLVPGLPSGFSFVSFDPAVVGAGVLAVVAVGLLASTVPAIRAMGLPVAEELRAP
jgi:ABC-type antimicrobial peptide transport system permease subunit